MHTSPATASKPAAAVAPAAAAPQASQPVRRFTTAGLMQDQREVEIEHAGRIYRLRITQLNKLILTA
ncbi:hemin uptake protein HemP [Pseudoduganella sp.]|uniref:hemin uptake protein HemP n=1 Tax=Pseudoduganella sp. TaxID=1880898 RepID=UPI0035B01571